MHVLYPTIGLVRAEVTPEELSVADAVVMVTLHAAFDLDMVVHHARYVLDTRRRMTPSGTVEVL